MPFSHEDRKKVYDFFEKLLEKFAEPVHYEQLRGYVSQGEPMIRKYVFKECKGEKLLHYFQTRKNYFFVNFRNEVMLLNKKKGIKNAIPKVDKLGAKQHATTSNDISHEELTNRDNFSCSRSTSVSSRYESETSSVDDVFVDSNSSKESEHEKETIKYFSDYLASSKKLNLLDVEIKCLPKNIKHYVTKYLKKDIALFFKNHPEIFYVDDKNIVSLRPLHKLCQDFTAETREETVFQDDDIISLYKYIYCAEFFLGILKKKSLPLSYLSGHLSRVTPDISDYLKSNYANFKDFLLDADKLFVFNDHDEVAVTKDGPKLMRYANKLLHADSTISLQSRKYEIYSYLKTGISKKQNSLSENNQVGDCPDAKQLDISNTKVLNEDNLNLNNNKKLKPEKLNISDEENTNIENIDSNETKSDNLSSVKEKKLKTEKLNVSRDENINVSSIDCNKTLDDKFKRESIIAGIYEENVIEIASEEIASDVGETFEASVDPDDSVFDKIKSTTQRNFIECIFTIQLLCLEIIEKQLILCYEYEHEAVKHFVEVLETQPSEMSDVNSLKGRLGQASKNVNFFMKTLYKGDKISLFFEKYDEFDLTDIKYKNVMSSPVSSGVLKLSPTYKHNLEEKRKIHQRYSAGEKMYDVYDLYDSQLHYLFIDVLDCLIKICCCFRNKYRFKLTRLSSDFSKFSPSQQNFINLLDETVIQKKIERFLCYFSFFEITEECIEFCPEHLDITLFINSITDFIQKLNTLSTYEESKLVYFDYLLDYLKTYKNDYSVMNFDEIRAYVIDGVQNFLSCCSDFGYSNLPNVVGYEILHNLVLKKKDSQFLIKLLQESNLFLLSDGKISHKHKKDKEVDFISVSNSSYLILSEDSSKESSATENAKELSEGKEQIFNDEYVDEICDEDLEISSPRKSSFIEGDMHVDTFNKNLKNKDSAEGLFNQNKFSDQQQDKQNDLNYVKHENECSTRFISSTFDESARTDNKNNMQKNYHHSDVPSSEEDVLNIDTENNIYVSTFDKEVDTVSKSHYRNDSVLKVDKNSVNELNNEQVLGNTDLTIKQEISPYITEVNSSINPPKPHLLKNSKIDYSKICESLCLTSDNAVSSSNSVKESNTSEICTQLSSAANDSHLNYIENILSSENDCEKQNDENLSAVSTSVMNVTDKQLKNISCHDHKPGSDHEKCVRNDNLDQNSSLNTSNNIKSHPTSNFESSHNSNKTEQNKASEPGNNYFPNPTHIGSPESKSNSIESDSEADKTGLDFDSPFLQPLEAKIIVLTLDSCIAETVFNGQKKCLFCLKSCFHCDIHSECFECFNLLVVGDEILCYIPPAEDFNCGNMCFAFMFHKDQATKEVSENSLDTKDFRRDNSSEKNQPNCLSSKNDRFTSYRDNNNMCNQYVQSSFDEVNFHSSVVEEERQVQYPAISQNTLAQSPGQSQSAQLQSQTTQTVESSLKKCLKIEKECQAKCKSVSQITQTVNVTSEADCQTVLVGEVKPCVPVYGKACMTRFPTLSQSTQTVCEALEHSSQTNISGDINPRCDTFSCECQTLLIGPVQKCSSLTDKCCQTLFSRQDAKTTQTETEKAAEMALPNETDIESLSFANIPCDANTGARSKHSSLVAQKESCDIACQTRSTGPVMIRDLYHDEQST